MGAINRLVVAAALIGCCVSASRGINNSNTFASWQLLTNDAYSPARSDQTISVFRGSLVATGAENYTVNYTVTNEVIQTEDGVNWLVKPPGPWSPRGYSASASYVDDTGVEWMLLSAGGACTPPFTGSVCHSYTWTDDLWRTNDSVMWEEVGAAGPRWGIRGGHTLDNLNGTLVLTGGLNNTNQLNDVWLSGDGGLSWKLSAPSAPWSPRSFHASSVGVDASGRAVLYMCGGGNLSGPVAADAWMTYDGVVWTPLPFPIWSARFAHTLTFVPSVATLVVTGGYHALSSAAMNDVWTSVDYGNSWQLATANASWAPRSFHSAIVLPATGQLLISGGWLALTQPDYPWYQYAYYKDVWVASV